MFEDMGMADVYDNIEEVTGLSRYRMARAFTKAGISLANANSLKISKNKEEGVQGARIQVLLALFHACILKGVKLDKCIKWFSDEFMDKKTLEKLTDALKLEMELAEKATKTEGKKK